MPRVVLLCGIFALLLAGCAAQESAESPKSGDRLTFRIGSGGVEEMTLSVEGLTSTCKATPDRTAAYFEVENTSDRPLVCDFLCVFGDPKAGEETFTLACDGVAIPASTSGAAYCRRDTGALTQGLGSISKFNTTCE